MIGTHWGIYLSVKNLRGFILILLCVSTHPTPDRYVLIEEHFFQSDFLVFFMKESVTHFFLQVSG